MLIRFQKTGLATILAGLVALTSSSFVHSEESLTVLSIAGGGEHTCALLSNGTVRCWGNNRHGGLGNGTITVQFESSVQVATIDAARQIAAGVGSTCASLADGTVRCWGDNEYGQLGNGTTTKTVVPVVVTGLHTATAVAVGFHHACALLKEGSIACWGRNEHGQLGNATQRDSSIPVSVKGIATATALSAGDAHMCALLQGGTVRCWGRNDSGQLGTGTKRDASTPVDVAALQSVTAISAGNGFTCAVLSNGRIMCWGVNSVGQLGNGTREEALLPVETTGITSAQTVDSGSHHACALLREGRVKCWGFNAVGQLGNGAQDYIGRPFHEQSMLTPVEVVNLKSVRDVTTGQMHSCAVEGMTTVTCWGSNINGGYYSREVNYATSTPVVIPVIPEGKSSGEK